MSYHLRNPEANTIQWALNKGEDDVEKLYGDNFKKPGWHTRIRNIRTMHT
jgi:hypothetical protein